MVQYLHFRILEFPFIDAYTTTYVAQVRIQAAFRNLMKDDIVRES